MNPFDDYERYDVTLDRVEQFRENEYEVRFDGSWETILKCSAIEPRVGDIVTFWGHMFGPRRGFAINGQVVEYKTVEQQKEQWDREAREREQKQKEAYDKALDDHNRRISNMPPEFQQRFKDFRATSPDWGWQYESYELATSEEAVRLVDHFKTEEALIEFSAMDYKEQQDVYEADSNHSGNTWGHAQLMARLYLKNPELVPQAHAAICPIVGCKNAGCYAGRAS